MENTIMDNYEIKLDRRVLKQLGSQLYGDTPSVIAELVANSYDADANNVWITIDTVNNNVIVEDDGKGMTAGDINESFLNIGYDKRSDNGVTDSGRKIMGRKGIGKLATFSLTNTVRVLSSKDHKKAGCILDFKRITVLSATQNAKSGKRRDKPKLSGINQHKADCYAVCCVSQVVYPARFSKVSCQKNRCVFASIFLYLLKRRSILNNRFKLF